MQNQFLTEETPAEHVSHTETATVETTPVQTGEMLLSEEAVTELLAQSRRKIRRKIGTFWSILFAAVATTTLAVFLDTQLNAGIERSFKMQLPVFLVVVVPLFCVGILRGVLRPGDIDAEQLARVGGKQAIPILMSARRSGSVQMQRASRAALTTLLPQLQATDADLLTASDRNELNGHLLYLLVSSQAKSQDYSFGAAILKAYEQVGDASAIPFVERLAKGKPRTEQHRQIQEAAQACLPMLRARVSGLTPEQTLLRASAAHVAAPDTLLRPASAAAPTSEKELLRATMQDEAPPVA